MDPKRFNSAMTVLSLATNTDLSAEMRLTWFKLLAHVDDALLETAFRRAAIEAKAWPSVGMIAEFVADASCGASEPAKEAWRIARTAVSRYSVLEPSKAAELLGRKIWVALGGEAGWRDLCNMREGDAGTYFAQFRDAYREFERNERRDQVLPPELRPAITVSPGHALLTAASAQRRLPEPVIEQPPPEKVAAAKAWLADGLARRERARPKRPPEPVAEETERYREASVRVLGMMIAEKAS